MRTRGEAHKVDSSGGFSTVGTHSVPHLDPRLVRASRRMNQPPAHVKNTEIPELGRQILGQFERHFLFKGIGMGGQDIIRPVGSDFFFSGSARNLSFPKASTVRSHEQ